MKLRKLVFLAIMISASIVLSIVESMISVAVFIIPGVKLGLANIVTLIILYIYSEKDALTVVMIRVFLVGLIYTSFTPPFWMSLSGGVLAIISMIVAKRFIKMSIIGVSVAGALFHMIGQILMAMIVLNTETLIYYLPWMMLISVPTGIFTGVVANKMQNMLHNQWSHTEDE